MNYTFLLQCHNDIFGYQNYERGEAEMDKEFDMDSLMSDFKSFEDMDKPTFGQQFVASKEEKKSKKEKKKKEKEKQEEAESRAMDNWMAAMSSIKFSPTVDKKGARHYDFDELFTEGVSHKKKKKKKKKKGELTDFNKEFEQETRLVKNILAQQTKFTDSLQKRYDILESSKTAARGVGKFTTDLIESINTSRNISLAAIKELAAIKKTAIDLHMKEKKEMQDSGIDEQNLSTFSANLLKQAISEDRSKLTNYVGIATPVDGTEDDIFENLSEEMRDEERPEEVDKMLKYEAAGVEVYAVVNKETENWYLIAKDENDVVVPDYPLPEPENLYFNHDSTYASDDYHVRYEIIWE